MHQLKSLRYGVDLIPFVIAEIRSEMKIRDKWRKLSRKTSDPLVWAKYRKKRNEIKRKLRCAEHKYAEQQIRNNSDNK